MQGDDAVQIRVVAVTGVDIAQSDGPGSGQTGCVSCHPEQLDHSPGPGWTFRQLAFYVAGSDYYADAVGDLTRTEP